MDRITIRRCASWRVHIARALRYRVLYIGMMT
jgi:hypothetical protein